MSKKHEENQSSSSSGNSSSDENEDDSRKDESRSRKEKSEKKSKSRYDVSVDPRSNLEEEAHVYKYKRTTFSRKLEAKDDREKTNFSYKIQVLESNNEEGRKSYWLFTASEKKGNESVSKVQTVKFSSAKEACEKYKKLYENEAEKMDSKGKSKNKKDRSRERSKSPRERNKQESGHSSSSKNYQDRETREGEREKHSSSSKHSERRDNSGDDRENKGHRDRSEPIEKLLFNLENMKKILSSLGVDKNKLPISKINANELKKAFKVLHYLNKERSSEKIHKLSKEFYALIPMEKEKSTDIIDLTKFSEKYNLVKALFNLEKASSIFQKSNRNMKDCKKRLNTDISTIERDSPGYRIIDKYVKNTQVHKTKLTILEVFKISRSVEKERYESLKKIENRMLLWHGSNITNYAAILSNGFKLASTVHGKFGPGIYFTDTVSKAANFCLPPASGNVILLALCEVALGKILKMEDVKVVSELPKGKDSILGLGKTLPDLENGHERKDGVFVPNDKPIKHRPSNNVISYLSKIFGGTVTGSLAFNEYVIHDEKQINIQYLVKLRIEKE